MTESPELPRIHPDLTVQHLSGQEYVVKLRVRREYFSVGPEEAFLIQELQRPHTRTSLKDAFEREFHERLSTQDVRDFIDLARKRRLLIGEEQDASQPAPDDEEEDDLLATNKQSPLFFRISLFDPNEAFNRWEPRLRWIWTFGFLVASASIMLLALMVLWSNRSSLMIAFPEAFRWETILVAWIVIIASTALHEMAHGLTCKHFGGDVHDTGVLFMFFMPCLYANVSDAWLIPEKWKRLWITAAGGYCDLCLWALAVFVWRITVPATLVNHLAFVALSVCGGRSLLNFNPLLRLDGYYLISDWLSIPNLRTRSQEYWMSHVRWILWGAARPPSESGGRMLLAYGAMCWVFAIVFLDIIFLRLLKFSSNEFGLVGITVTCLLAMILLKRVFKGLFRSEFMNMLTERRGRAAKWVGGIVAVFVGVFLVPVKHYATGQFEVRPGKRHQVASPFGGYVRTVFVDDGESVRANTPLLQLESNDLENRLAMKRSEMIESEAQLAKLKSGTRHEEISDQKARVRRLEEWVEQGERDLERASFGLKQELVGLDQGITQAQAGLQFAQVAHQQSTLLYQQGALAGAELKSEETRLTVLASQVRQAEALRRAREAEGTRQIESELIRREQQLADAKSRLFLLEAGARPEELVAEQARRDRLAQELSYLEDHRSRLVVVAPFDGVVATPRIQEQVGTLASPGAAICTIEDASQSFIEISVPEEEVVGLQPGQTVYLKARAIPFETFLATVDRIAPSTAAVPGSVKTVTTLVVYCTLENADGRLRTGMSGFGRIDRGWNSLGLVLARKGLGYLRTEFWW